MTILRKVVAFGLLTLLLVKAMVIPAIFLNYELRKDYIIQNFCVNKDRPELKCDGKCYLAKQIKAAQQQDENEGTANFVNKLLVFDCIPSEMNWQVIGRTLLSTERKLTHGLQHLNGTSAFDNIFHPPQILA